MGGVAVICLACNGAGEIKVGEPDEWRVCDACGGSGEVEDIDVEDES